MALRNSLRIMLAAGGMALAGCATTEKGKPVAAGDQVGVNFTCRLKNGDIAVSTSKEITGNAALPKSAIFLPRKDDGALTITAGRNAREKAADDNISFEDRVTGLIAAEVVGLTPGEKLAVQFRAERREKDSKGQENTIQINRVNYRPRDMEMAKSELLARTGKAPVEEQEVDLGEGMRAKVVSLSGDNAKLRVSASPEAQIQTPFGPGKVTEAPTDLKITIDARVGSLARTGPLVGRVAAVDDNSITLDYGHPFGGEELNCDVVVEPAAKTMQQGDERVEK